MCVTGAVGVCWTLPTGSLRDRHATVLATAAPAAPSMCGRRVWLQHHGHPEHQQRSAIEVIEAVRAGVPAASAAHLSWFAEAPLNHPSPLPTGPVAAKPATSLQLLSRASNNLGCDWAAAHTPAPASAPSRLLQFTRPTPSSTRPRSSTCVCYHRYTSRHKRGGPRLSHTPHMLAPRPPASHNILHNPCRCFAWHWAAGGMHGAPCCWTDLAAAAAANHSHGKAVTTTSSGGQATKGLTRIAYPGQGW
jgi:hypothetical protein